MKIYLYFTLKARTNVTFWKVIFLEIHEVHLIQ